jgi:DNA (cytosine-5)-methyltransferase 1
MNYYNECEPYLIEWLNNLIRAKLIPRGDVDGRKIEDVRPSELTGYTQCHFFAGIGGWPLALQLAGWNPAMPVWTGSPPCQDNSCASIIWGKRLGTDGERSGTVHTWLGLIQIRKPESVFFENVPGIEPWLAPIIRRLESIGYTVSRQDRSAASVGAPHLRKRVWLVADINGARLEDTRQAGPPKVIGVPWSAAAGSLWGEFTGDSGLLDGWFPNRVAAVRAFGNAIVPQVAAEVIKAYMSVNG